MTIRDLIHVVTNGTILRRKDKIYTVVWLDEDDKMWTTLVCAYTTEYAKRILPRVLETNEAYIYEIVHHKDFYRTMLDNDNVYVSELEED